MRDGDSLTGRPRDCSCRTVARLSRRGMAPKRELPHRTDAEFTGGKPSSARKRIIEPRIVRPMRVEDRKQTLDALDSPEDQLATVILGQRPVVIRREHLRILSLRSPTTPRGSERAPSPRWGKRRPTEQILCGA